LLATLTSKTALRPAESSTWLDEIHLAEIRDPASDLSSDESLKEETSSQRLLVVWNTDTGETIASTETPNAEVIAASPDGKWIAEAGLDNRVRVRDSKSLQLTTEFRAYERRLSDGNDMLGNKRSMVWHPQQPVLATVSTDGSLKLWEMPTGRLISEVRNLALGDRNPSRPASITFSPDGETALINLIGSNFIWHAYPFQFLRSGGK
jgi:WD40 repeat protein